MITARTTTEHLLARAQVVRDAGRLGEWNLGKFIIPPSADTITFFLAGRPDV